MNNKNNIFFQKPIIEIVEVLLTDVIVTSPQGPLPFPGEDDEFDPLYWENN